MKWDGTCNTCGFQYMRDCLFLKWVSEDKTIDPEIGNMKAQCKCAEVLKKWLAESTTIVNDVIKNPKATDCKDCPMWSTFLPECKKTKDFKCPKEK